MKPGMLNYACFSTEWYLINVWRFPTDIYTVMYKGSLLTPGFVRPAYRFRDKIQISWTFPPSRRWTRQPPVCALCMLIGKSIPRSSITCATRIVTAPCWLNFLQLPRTHAHHPPYHHIFTSDLSITFGMIYTHHHHVFTPRTCHVTYATSICTAPILIISLSRLLWLHVISVFVAFLNQSVYCSLQVGPFPALWQLFSSDKLGGASWMPNRLLHMDCWRKARFWESCNSWYFIMHLNFFVLWSILHAFEF